MSNLTSVTDPENNTTIYEYDKLGNLIKATDPAGKVLIRKIYDGNGRLQKQFDALNNAYSYQYDAVGNLTSIILPNQQSKMMLYDQKNRLVRITYSDGSQVDYEYDANSNLISITDSNGATTYAYDKLDRLSQHTDTFGNVVSYGYDLNDNRISVTYPQDTASPARTVIYSYDVANQLDKITDWNNRVWDYSADGAGKLTSLIYPNGLNKTWTYDNAGRIQSLRYLRVDNSELMSLQYTLDPQGNPTEIVKNGTISPEALLAFDNTSYEYDEDNRLLNEVRPNSNRSFRHDTQGNVIQSGNDSYEYNIENHLIHQTDGLSTVTHTYDGFQNRIERQENGQTVRYVLDHGRDMSHILCEMNNSGRITAYYIHGPEIAGQIDSTGQYHFYHTDHISSVLALSDDSGILTDQYAYTPFGRMVHEGSSQNPFTYVGGLGVMHEKDDLYFMRARFYDAQSGRFWGKDPVDGIMLLPNSYNRIIYANNNPMVYIDEEGKFSFTFWGACTGIIEGAVNFGLENDYYTKGVGGYWAGAIKAMGYGMVKGAAVGAAVDLQAVSVPLAILTTYTVKTGFWLGENYYDGDVTLGDLASFTFDTATLLFDFVPGAGPSVKKIFNNSAKATIGKLIEKTLWSSGGEVVKEIVEKLSWHLIDSVDSVVNNNSKKANSQSIVSDKKPARRDRQNSNSPLIPETDIQNITKSVK